MRRVAAVGVTLGLALLVVLLLPILSNQRLTTTEATLFQRATPFDESVDAIQRDMLDMETGERGFRLTGSADFLVPYSDGQQRFAADASDARRYASSFGGVFPRLLQQALDAQAAWQQWAAADIQTRQNGQGMLSQGDANAMQGKRLFDAWRSRVNVLQVQTDGLRQRTQVDVNQARRLTGLASDFAAALVAALGGVFLVLYLRQHRLERNARSAARYARQLMESTPDALFVIDSDTLRLLDANGVAERLSGYTRAELLQLHAADLLIPEQRDTAPTIIQRILTTGAIEQPLAATFPHSDGRRVPVEFVARVARINSSVLIIAQGRDVTARLAADTALHESEARYRRIFEANQAIKLVIDAVSGRIVDANPAACEFYGYDAAALQQLTIQQIVDLPTQQVDGELVEAAEDRRHYFRRRHRLASGELREVEVYTSRIESDGRQLLYSIVHDISDRVEAEEALRRREVELLALNRQLESTIVELKQAQSSLIEQERLRALGEMASGIAHDFNNTLAPVLGFSEILLSDPSILLDSARTTRYLTLINTAAKDAAGVVRRMRQFYRAREPEETLQPVDVNALVGEAVMLTQPRWRDQALTRGITISLKTETGEAPPIYGDPSELREVLINLIFNAVDAMENDGTITLKTECEGEYVVVRVRDTGRGMTPAVRDRALQPFFTTKGPQGTGLGLATSYGVVRRHGGTLEIESTVGQGTTISICLPRDDAVRQPEAATAPSPALSVLLVDDEPVVREVTETYLRMDGHSVEVASNGREALERFVPGRFDLVLTDMAMPELSGDQLALRIRERSPTQPVFLLTGFGDILHAADGLPPGVDRILSKPVTLPRLREALQGLASG